MDEVLIICEMENMASWLVNNAKDYRTQKMAQAIRHNIQLLSEIHQIAGRIKERGYDNNKQRQAPSAA